jgi:sarcosine oxidase, subunit beta
VALRYDGGVGSLPRVAVVGAGIVGASVAWYLAGRGFEVVVLERADGPATGSTGRSAAGLRHQFSLEANVRFSRFSARRFAAFKEEVGGRADFARVGYLFLVPPPLEAAWRAQTDMVRRLDVRVEWLAPDALERWPYVRGDGLAAATFGPEDGVLDPHAVTLGYLRSARGIGAEVRFGAEVTKVDAERGGVRLVAGGDTLLVDRVVNAAGPQAGLVARLAGVTLPVVASRRCVYATEPLPALKSPTPLVIDLATGVWLRSEGQRLIFGRTNPDEPPGEHEALDWAWLDATLEVALPRFPILAEAGLDRRACWAGHYEVTPDHLPAIGFDPQHPWLVHAAGFSGHGVQHAPATGLAVADLLLDGRCDDFDLSPFDPGRFARGTVRREGAIV